MARTKKSNSNKNSNKNLKGKPFKGNKPPKKEERKIYAYARVSSTEQSGPNHVSLEAQIARINQYIAGNNYHTVTDTVTEVGSARHPEKLKKLMEIINKAPPNSYIWVHRFDRFSRNVEFAASTLDALLERNVRVMSVMEPNYYFNDDEAEKDKLIDIFSHAQYESDHRSRVVKETFQAIKSSGGIIGVPPFGTQLKNPKKRTREEVELSREQGTYTLPDRSIICDYKEQQVLEILRGLRFGTLSINQINELLKKVVPAESYEPIIIDDNKSGKPLERTEAGAISFQNLAELMNEYSVPYRRGLSWSSTIIKRLLFNPICVPDDDTKLMLEMDNLNLVADANAEELPPEPIRPRLRRQKNVGKKA